MDYFNFSHLPLLVKEMIADEIVHNSIPEDRIQFATTCKAFNQLVKDAKPKKIIRQIRLYCRINDVSFRTNSGSDRSMTLPGLRNILQQCQVENLSLDTGNVYDEHFLSELMDLLLEPCRFVTVLTIDFNRSKFKFVDFYKKMRHLKSLTIYGSSRIIKNLPYFPPKLVLRCEYPLPLLAEKTLNHPLSFLKMGEVTLTDVQQFLMTANLEIGARISFWFENKFTYFLTFIGNGLFEFEMLREFDFLILSQQISTQNKKILKLSTDFWINEEIPFTVTSVSNPDIVVCSGELTRESSEKIISENIAECVKVSNPDYSTYYPRQLLENWFPRTENYDPFERVKTINKTLGTNISVITPEMLEEKWCLF